VGLVATFFEILSVSVYRGMYESDVCSGLGPTSNKLVPAVVYHGKRKAYRTIVLK
jgi:hypothetical protein